MWRPSRARGGGAGEDGAFSRARRLTCSALGGSTLRMGN
jgi:hypothetical protein